MMIDPALLASESLSSETNDGSISREYVMDGRLNRHSARISAAEKATNSLAITDVMAVHHGLGLETFPEF